MKKIAVKIFLMFNVVVCSVLIFLFFANHFWLEGYYLNYKEKQIYSIARKITLNPNISIHDLEDSNNLKIQILPSERYIRIRNKFKRFLSPDEMLINLLDMNFSYEKLSTIATLKIIENHKNEDEKFIVLVKKLNENEVLIVNSPFFAIKESVKISTAFLAFTFLFGLFISIILSIYMSRKIGIPIMTITEKTRNMANLNFEDKLKIKRNDELGSLAKSINTLSQKLKDTINNLKITNKRLQLEVKKEKEIDKMRREFVDNVNHELKTPIAIIEGYAEGLLDNVATAEDREFYCEVIIDETKKMNELVKKLLLASKYDNNFVSLNLEKVNLVTLVNNLLKKYKLDIENKELDIIRNFSTEKTILGDIKELSSAIDNYISNAISYTKNGDTIVLSIEESDNDIEFSVKNPCEFISQEEIEILFEPFSKLDKARTRKYGGTGLGLSIVKKIISLHNGSYGGIYDTNSIKFYFKLPIN